MENESVQLLNPGRGGTGNDYFKVGQATGFAAGFAEQGDGFDPFGFGGLEREHDIVGITAGGKHDEHIAGLSKTFNLAGKKVVKTVVVADAGEQSGIGIQRDGWQGGAFLVKPADQFLSQMQGIRSTAAIAGGKELFAIEQGGFDFHARRENERGQLFESLGNSNQLIQLCNDFLRHG